jgi:hypothetical protein
MQPTTTNGRGTLVALLCAAAFAGGAVPAISAMADDTSTATTQEQPSTLQVQETTPSEPAPGAGPDGRDCPEKDGAGGGGSGGTADPAAPADSTEL